jgi:hypothetical protein
MNEKKKSVRVAGHSLLREGAAYSSEGNLLMYRPRLGHGKCSCGEVSPLMSSGGARKRWHREHKIVLQGVSA